MIICCYKAPKSVACLLKLFVKKDEEKLTQK